jgi:hypothetical protein
LRFNPLSSFATPRSLGAQIRPDPRVVADDVWAKLLWAGPHLAEDDLPHGNEAVEHGRRHKYPLAIARAIVLVWLFAGIRSDELRRLTVGCVRRQRTLADTSGTQICQLRVPVNKTSISSRRHWTSRPAVEEWERIRPDQPLLLDVKTGECVHFLFMYRGQRIGKDYLNNSLTPALCRKAGIPEHDARGDLTSHRARSTIASQLANARDPMSLFELMEWLGHKNPQSTVHYVKSSLARQAKQYEAAGYRDRNLRSISVLINRNALRGPGSGVGENEGGIYYDLGHGYCRRVLRPMPPPSRMRALPVLRAEGLTAAARPRGRRQSDPPSAGSVSNCGGTGRHRWRRRRVSCATRTKLERAYASRPNTSPTRSPPCYSCDLRAHYYG